MHEIFSIPELVETILLQTDTRSLLTSAQRVCRHWNELIKTSNNLQAALFMKRTRDRKKFLTQERQMNPLIEKLWHEFFRRKYQSRTGKLPPLDPLRENAYLRQEASWRQMLLHQPPTYRIGIIETDRIYNDAESAEYTEVVIKMDDSYLRLGHLHEQLVRQRVLPGQDTLILWERFGWLKHQERQNVSERAMATSTYLKTGCDVVVFCGCSYLLQRRWENARLPIDYWLDSAEKWKILADAWHVPIFDD
ncbi:hypothetical protein BDW59DRAFT_163460 [Aspergillus cavernicola]|uniref:F-box domain-containing protein n=1 Tax=Aspergillus cavernicola TaxID=176166 RepID=A0ABR4I6B9_9EURO